MMLKPPKIPAFFLIRLQAWPKTETPDKRDSNIDTKFLIKVFCKTTANDSFWILNMPNVDKINLETIFIKHQVSIGRKEKK